MSVLPENCLNCRFYFPITDPGGSVPGGYGICRRFPPLIASSVTASFQPKFIGAEMWCGEHKTFSPPPEGGQ